MHVEKNNVVIWEEGKPLTVNANHHPRNRGAGDVETSTSSNGGGVSKSTKSEAREGQAREGSTCGEQSQGKNKRQMAGYLLHSPANCNTRNWQEVEKKATGKGKLDEMITTVFAAGWQNCEITTNRRRESGRKDPYHLRYRMTEV
ncbi:hypothetical protein TNCT_271801 [Trichonephila clavata]|uniref:Uncharacterized protein n=1 Tax=Trichonephila clavata TaxID=2740835 RepID=A0A8X6L0F3_TRICU|nr:hypothetical protein TNCT_271801 [Trichonephila clavata]